MFIKHPEHLEPDPLKREEFCPVKVSVSNRAISIHEVQCAIIKTKTKTEALSVLLEWASQYGINGDADPEWWEKRSKLGVTEPGAVLKN
jgi:hypothetical protein